MWNPFRRNTAPPELSDEAYARAKREILSDAPIPNLWLLGKTGSGKSSIVRFLTGADDATVGRGFKPETRLTSRFDFPDSNDPLMTFFDTRGLGEAGYDPAEDVGMADKTAHLLILTVRVMDHATEDLHRTVSEIRRRNRDRPVILALTCLHDAYPGEQHLEPDPFGPSSLPLPGGISDDLRRSLETQYERFDGLFDCAVPIDLTPEFEGFDEPEYGGERLKSAIIDALPAAYRFNLLQLDKVLQPLEDVNQKQVMSTILGSSTIAATAAAVPVPWVDIPVVIGIQTHLAYKLAQLHGQTLDKTTLAQVSGAIGGRLALRMAVREVLKFIPWVGMAANAAAAFAFTFATGMAWNWYFSQVATGHVPSEDELRDVFQNQLTRAGELWKQTH